MKHTPTILKVAAMLVAIPRYVGLMLFLSGFIFSAKALVALHISEGIAGLSLAVLEGFALAYILSRRQLGFSKADKGILYVVVALLLVLLPLCAAPYLLFLFDGSNLFAAEQPSFWYSSLKFAWATATASMPILIIIGVALVEKDPVDIELLNAERQAMLQQTLSKIEAETEQAILQYKVMAQQAKAELKHANPESESKAKSQAKAPSKAKQKQTKSIEPQGEFACDACGRTFATVQALSAHGRFCEAEPANVIVTNGKHS